MSPALLYGLHVFVEEVPNWAVSREVCQHVPIVRDALKNYERMVTVSLLHPFVQQPLLWQRWVQRPTEG